MPLHLIKISLVLTFVWAFFFSFSVIVTAWEIFLIFFLAFFEHVFFFLLNYSFFCLDRKPASKRTLWDSPFILQAYNWDIFCFNHRSKWQRYYGNICILHLFILIFNFLNLFLDQTVQFKTKFLHFISQKQSHHISFTEMTKISMKLTQGCNRK